MLFLLFEGRLTAAEFIGQDAILEISKNGCDRARVGIELTGRRIAREGTTIHAAATCIGEVTSGTFSPTLQKSIARGYVKLDRAGTGESVELDVRGRRESGQIVPLPFYSRKAG